MEEKVKIRFFIEYGAGCLWSGNSLARDKFGVGCLNSTMYDLNGNISEEPAIKLPIDLEFKSQKLVKLYYKRLDQNDPSGPGLWDEFQLSEFYIQTKKLFEEIKTFLGPEIELTYEQE